MATEPAPPPDARSWLESAQADADRRNLPALRLLLKTLAGSMEALRTADWNDNAAAATPQSPEEPAR
jgi:hypothetical protein